MGPSPGKSHQSLSVFWTGFQNPLVLDVTVNLKFEQGFLPTFLEDKVHLQGSDIEKPLSRSLFALATQWFIGTRNLPSERAIPNSWLRRQQAGLNQGVLCGSFGVLG